MVTDVPPRVVGRGKPLATCSVEERLDPKIETREALERALPVRPPAT